MATSRHVAATNYGGKTRCSDEYQKVFFYVPNLIGYTRVLLTAAAVYCMYHESPFWVFFLYGASEFLDVADGYYARKFNQCSKFGEVLDM
ncbi:phosphatidylinositol synthase 1 (CDP-alcohol phosphatidyltransferase1), partial [Spiromyces aspiralis]